MDKISSSTPAKVDFTRELPIEISISVFDKLSNEHLIKTSLVSKGWKQVHDLTPRGALLATLRELFTQTQDQLSVARREIALRKEDEGYLAYGVNFYLRKRLQSPGKLELLQRRAIELGIPRIFLNLDSLNLSGFDLSPKMLQSLGDKGIKELILSGRGVGVKNLGNVPNGLQTLKLCNCSISEDVLHAIPDGRKFLQFRKCTLSPTALMSLSETIYKLTFVQTHGLEKALPNCAKTVFSMEFVGSSLSSARLEKIPEQVNCLECFGGDLKELDWKKLRSTVNVLIIKECKVDIERLMDLHNQFILLDMRGLGLSSDQLSRLEPKTKSLLPKT